MAVQKLRAHTHTRTHGAVAEILRARARLYKEPRFDQRGDNATGVKVNVCATGKTRSGGRLAFPPCFSYLITYASHKLPRPYDVFYSPCNAL